MNIYEKLNEVRKCVAYVKKDKEVGGKYMAITHDAVTASVREHLVTHGILIVPTVIKSVAASTAITTGKGVPFIRYEATYNISFVNCEKPEERVDVIIEAHALDEGDKAPGKAISYATKYAMLKLFSIETGDDEEARPQMKPVREPAKDEGEALARQIIDTNQSPGAEALESLTPEVRQGIRTEAKAIEGDFYTMTAEAAHKRYTHVKESLDDTETVALWHCLDSKVRTGIKKHNNSLKESA